MNEDRIKGKWKQLAGNIKTKWGKLTDDDLKIAEGDSPVSGRPHPGALRHRQGRSQAPGG